jgi:hypothetical protein
MSDQDFNFGQQVWVVDGTGRIGAGAIPAVVLSNGRQVRVVPHSMWERATARALANPGGFDQQAIREELMPFSFRIYPGALYPSGLNKHHDEAVRALNERLAEARRELMEAFGLPTETAITEDAAEST